jgi:23S rRNA pseudouridine955/2504/2580 synthase
LCDGDTVRVAPVRISDEKPPQSLSKERRLLVENMILFEDDFFVVVDKPNGLAVHGGSGISAGLIEQLRIVRSDHHFWELVHRLDRDTSGLILIAKKRAALIALQALFRSKTSQGVKGLGNNSFIEKKYIAVVHGQWPKDCNKVSLSLLKNEPDNGGERMLYVNKLGKTALTRYEILAKSKNYTLLEAQPITGRTHQIRVHCLSQGCVIAGDEKYRDKLEEGVDKLYKITRLCLHAHQLKFVHPMTQEKVSYKSLPKGKMLDVLNRHQLNVF